MPETDGSDFANRLSGKVLVLGSDFKNYRTCLAIVRSLGRAGLEVHLGWQAADEIAGFSRYVAKKLQLPPYSSDNNDWYESLTAVLKRERYDLVIPANEQACAPLEQNRNLFADYPEIYQLNPEAYEIVFDKIKTATLAQELNIPMPPQIILTDLNDFERSESEIGYPAVLKPKASFELADLKRKLYVYKAVNRPELLTVARHLLDHGPVIVQKHVPGIGVGIEFLAFGGRILFAFQHRRLHEPPLGGGSSYRRSCPIDTELIAYLRPLLAALCYTGVGMAEFRVDSKGGRKWFLEINGRFWGSLPLAVAAGADFPRFLYLMRCQQVREFGQEYKTSIYCRNSIRDFEWILANRKIDKKNPLYNSESNIKVIAEFGNILLGRERNDTIAIDDPLPAIVEFGKLLWLILKKSADCMRSNSPARWLASRRLRGRLRRAQSLLFVCYGNIYRSPFAAAAAKRLLPNSVKVESAGYYPKTGRKPHQRAIDIAAEFGLDIENHRSTIVDSEKIRRAEIIFVFDRANAAWLKTNFPESKGKLAFLGLLRYRGPVEIGDPVAGNLYTVRDCYRRILQALEPLKRLKSEKT